MIESPVLHQFWATTVQKAIQLVLEARFGQIPENVIHQLSLAMDEERLDQLTRLAGICSNLEVFAAFLASLPAQPDVVAFAVQAPSP